MTAPRVVVLTRAGCHLCESACAVVAEVCRELAVEWELRDIDASDATTLARWSELVPVVEIDGAVHEVLRVDATRLRSALGAPAPH
jgi:flavoprotein